MKKMNLNEYENRLQAMCDRECEYLRRKKALSKQFAKESKTWEKNATKATMQLKLLFELQSELDKAQVENEKIKKIVKEKKEELERQKKLLAKLQQDFAVNAEERWAVHQQNIKEMCQLRYLKDMSQIFINFKALPESIQGVAVCQQADDEQWKPFRLVTGKHTQAEVQELLWHCTRTNSVLCSKWEELILVPTPADPELRQQYENADNERTSEAPPSTLQS